MAKVGKRKIHTVSVTIRWCEEEVIAEVDHGEHGSPALVTAAQSQHHTKGTANNGKAAHNIARMSALPPIKRLLPSDRVVLNALRARVPQGEQVTTQVRTRELESECEISRRQVQICVRRLRERGLIKRLIDDSDVGGNGGFRYHLSKDALR